MKVGNIDMEQNNSNENFEGIISGAVKNSNKSVSRIEGEQFDSIIENRKRSSSDVERKIFEENTESSYFDVVSKNIQDIRGSVE